MYIYSYFIFRQILRYVTHCTIFLWRLPRYISSFFLVSLPEISLIVYYTHVSKRDFQMLLHVAVTCTCNTSKGKYRLDIVRRIINNI